MDAPKSLKPQGPALHLDLFHHCPSANAGDKWPWGCLSPGLGPGQSSSLRSSPCEMGVVFYVMTSEFNSPCVGEAGLRVSRWLLGFRCACWGPSAAHLQQEQKVLSAWGGITSLPFCGKLHLSARESRIRPWRARTESPVVRIPKGTLVLQNLVTIVAAACCSLNRIRPWCRSAAV